MGLCIQDVQGDRNIALSLGPCTLFKTGICFAGRRVAVYLQLNSRLDKNEVYLLWKLIIQVGFQKKQTGKKCDQWRKMVNIRLIVTWEDVLFILTRTWRKEKSSEIWIACLTLNECQPYTSYWATIKKTTVSFQESCRFGSDPQQADNTYSEPDSNILMS